MAIWIVLVAVGVVFGFVALAYAYWGLLASLYPDRIHANEVYTIRTDDLWRLRICRYRHERTQGPPVLLVHGGLVNQHNLTSPEGGCMADYLAERGFDCWAIDLRGTRSSIPPFEHHHQEAKMDDYLLHDLPTAIDFIRQKTQFSKVHAIGHSMGGVLLYAYALAFGGDKLMSITTLGAPVGFDSVAPPSQLLVSMARYMPGVMTNLVRGSIPISILLRTSLPNMPVNMRNLHPAMDGGCFYRMTEEPLQHVIGEISHMIRSRTMRMNGDTLDVKAGLAELDVPLFAIFGAKDPLVPLTHGLASFEAITMKDKRVMVLGKEQGYAVDYSHGDLAYGATGARDVFQPIANWLEDHPISEMVAAGEFMGDEDDVYVTPLKRRERSGLLSGSTYDGDKKAKTKTKYPVTVEIEEKSGTVKKRAAKKKAVAKKKTTTRKKAVAKKKTVTKKKAVVKKKKVVPKKGKAKLPPSTRSATLGASKELKRLDKKKK